MVPLCGVRREMLLVAIAVVPAALRLFYVFARREPALAPAAGGNRAEEGAGARKRMRAWPAPQ